MTSVTNGIPPPSLPQISFGSFSKVYHFSQEEIIKVMEPEKYYGLSAAQLKECSIYFRLNEECPHLVQTDLVAIDTNPRNYSHSVVMKMEKMTTDVWMMTRKMFKMGFSDKSWLTKMVNDISVILNRLHLAGIAHRDIKPGNIMYDQQTDKFVLIDFGSIFYLDNQTRAKPGWTTYCFSSPECMPPDTGDSEGEDEDDKMDVDEKQNASERSRGEPEMQEMKMNGANEIGERSENRVDLIKADVFSFAACVISVALELFPINFTNWHILASEDALWNKFYGNNHPAWKSVLLDCVSPDPGQRKSIQEIRDAFGLQRSRNFHTPLQFKTFPAHSRRKVDTRVSAIYGLHPEIYLQQKTQLAEFVKQVQWSKVTLVSTIQLFEDFIMVQDLLPVSSIDAMHVLVACLSLIQNILEDENGTILELVRAFNVTLGSNNELRSSVILKLQKKIFLAMDAIIYPRRPLSKNPDKMDWTDLIN